MSLIIGSHVSYKNNTGLLGSVKEALSYGANTFMFYTGAPQNTIRSSIKEEYISKAIDLVIPGILLAIIITSFLKTSIYTIT